MGVAGLLAAIGCAFFLPGLFFCINVLLRTPFDQLRIANLLLNFLEKAVSNRKALITCLLAKTSPSLAELLLVKGYEVYGIIMTLCTEIIDLIRRDGAGNSVKGMPSFRFP